MQTDTTPGATLRAVRRAKGLSLRLVAGRADIDPAHLSRVERGQAQLSVDALHRLALVLDLRELAALMQPYVPVKDEQA